jgi:chromosome partitioning protein
VAFALGAEKAPGLYRLIVDEDPIDQVAVQARENLDIIPGDKRTEKAKRTVVISNFPTEILSRILQPADYDVVLLDMAPSLDVLHVSALMASDWVIIPTKLDAMAVDGVNEVLRSMGEVVERGHRLGYSILPTFFDRTTRETVVQLQAPGLFQFGRRILI